MHFAVTLVAPPAFATPTMRERTYLTTGERVRTYAGIGFLLSLALNAVVTALYPNLARFHERSKPDVIRLIRRAPLQPPTAAKPRVAKPVAKPKPFAANVPQPHDSRRSGPGRPRYVKPANGSPKGAPTAQPTCGQPNREAAVTR